MVPEKEKLCYQLSPKLTKINFEKAANIERWNLEKALSGDVIGKCALGSCIRTMYWVTGRDRVSRRLLLHWSMQGNKESPLANIVDEEEKGYLWMTRMSRISDYRFDGWKRWRRGRNNSDEPSPPPSMDPEPRDKMRSLWIPLRLLYKTLFGVCLRLALSVS